MSATRISGTIFLLLVAFVIGGWAVLPAPPSGSQSTGSIPVEALLGIAWFFALWSALVASMVFIIAWAANGMVKQERATAARAAGEPFAGAIPFEAPARAETKVFAKVS